MYGVFADGKYLFRINHRSRDTAFRNLNRFHDLVFPVEQHPEFFIRQFADEGMENCLGLLASGNFRLTNYY